MSDGAYGLGGPGVQPASNVSQLPVRPVRGRVIAEFCSGTDARMFASLKKCEGLDVTVMPSTNPQYMFCVRLLEPAL